MAKTDDNKAPRHKVLYIGARNDKGEFVKHRPLASRDENDPDAAEDFAMLRQHHLTEAHKAGAVRPQFRVVTEQEGEEV